MLVQDRPQVKAAPPIAPFVTANQFRTFITIQPKELGFKAVLGQTETLVVDSKEPLTRQQIRETHWTKRWTHYVVECSAIALNEAH